MSSHGTGPCVVVIGGGVIGLSIALELARTGAAVTVHADQPARDSVSALAGAVWFPFAAAPPDRVEAWSRATLPRLKAMAEAEGSGIRLREGLVVVRDGAFDTTWMSWVDGVREASPGELPRGARTAYAVDLPVIEMPVYLDHLESLCAAAGITITSRRIGALEELTGEADAIVVAAGMRSAALLGDDSDVYPIRGQVVRLANRGLDRWYLDEDNPGGITYVLPRSSDVVCGGSAEVGRDDTVFDEAEGERILERVRELVPALADAPVVSRGVGLRPGRAQVRLELVAECPVPVVACYGHGGAGVTTSWGCAEEVAALVSSLL